MTRAGLRLLLIVLFALLVGFMVGWRAQITFGEQLKVYPYPMRPPVPDDLAFMAFEIPDPTLPASCCVADVHDYAIPTISAPGTPLPAVAATADKPKGSAARTVARAVRVHRQLSGVARWHATGRDGLYAAAGCALRRAIGKNWRGEQVLVAYGRRAIAVRLNDAIGGCTRTLIDLSDESFRYLAPLSRGVLRVTVGW